MYVCSVSNIKTSSLDSIDFTPAPSGNTQGLIDTSSGVMSLPSSTLDYSQNTFCNDTVTFVKRQV